MARTPKPSLFPRELLEQSNDARRDYFRAYTVAHPTLATVDRVVWNAIHEPAGALLILVAGPTGVGKTTLLDHLEQRLCEGALPHPAQNPGHLPVVKLLAAAPATRQFKWADFFTRALLAIREPLVDSKVNPQALADRVSPSFTPRNRSDVTTLQLSWEHAVHYRHPEAIFIDEAQHLGEIGGGSSLLGQLDFLKSLAILTNTVYVLAGTYELLTLDTLSAQLGRRSMVVHFPRYQATNKDDVRAFKTVLLAFQRHLPVEEMPDLVSQWQDCYACTAGCIGLLKEWLLKALTETLERSAKTIEPSILAHHAPSLAFREQMKKEKKDLPTTRRQKMNCENAWDSPGVAKQRKKRQRKIRPTRNKKRQRSVPHQSDIGVPHMTRSKEVQRRMNKSVNPPYEEWVVTLPPIPQPSTLYSLNPIGVGTPSVESLTSYITRLAEAHCVFPGALMRHVIVPFAESHLTGEGRSTSMHLRDGESTGALNAHQQTAMNAVHTLESLTKQRGLHVLTMVAWAKVFPLASLIRTKRAWCPGCLEEWRTSGRVIYEPLLWAVQAVEICVQHGCQLETSCPKCTKTSPWLGWRSRSGYCTHCQQWLGMKGAVPGKNEQEMKWLHWSADQVGILLASVPSLKKFPARECINERLVSVLEQVSQGRKMTFARLVGLSPKLVGNWFYHQQLPGVENLLRVCFAVNLSLQDLFMEKQITCALRSEGMQDLWSSHHRQAPRGFWKSNQVRETLEAIARNEEIPPLSLKAIARQLECSDPHSLQSYHPVPSQMISDRYAAYMDAKKLITEQLHCKEVQDVVHQLIKQNIPPTGRNVASVLSKPGILRSPVVREARRAAIREREGPTMENR